MPAAITGVIGSIRWHYYIAADIDGYRITRQQGRWSLSARVVNADAFKLAQTPLMFVAPTKQGDFRWPITTLTVADGQLTASLGPPVG